MDLRILVDKEFNILETISQTQLDLTEFVSMEKSLRKALKHDNKTTNQTAYFDPNVEKAD